MERAFYERDAGFEGLFFVGVTTTNIFCRPTCPARRPLPQNVKYFAAPSEALFAGFRPCLRCRPMEIDPLPSWAAELVRELDAQPEKRIRAADLRARGIDPGAARRLFLKRFGMTFSAYTRARRLGNALASLRNAGTVDDAALGYGWESHSGFRTAFAKTFGTTPARSRELVPIHSSLIETALGPVVLGATDEALCMLEFADRRMLERQLATLQRRVEGKIVPGTNAVLDQAKLELDEYLAGSRTRFEVPFHAPGTDFQRAVWEAVRAIPYGETRSYESIAKQIGIPGAVRAVGRANGDNRLALIIPCHRVVTKSGELGGYGGGLWRKKRLLEMESSQGSIAAEQGE